MERGTPTIVTPFPTSVGQMVQISNTHTAPNKDMLTGLSSEAATAKLAVFSAQAELAIAAANAYAEAAQVLGTPNAPSCSST